jgi:hypothetical protein
MAKNQPPRQLRPRALPPGPVQVLGLLLALALGAPFALWRLSADPPPPGENAPLVAAAEPVRSVPAPEPQRPAVRSSVRIAPRSTPALPARAASAAELQSRATDEVNAQLETLRPYIASHCLPSAGVEGGKASATVTVSSTFDARGREIARGIGEDRRSPAAELASCMRSLEGIALSISPPGSNVGISVPVTFP